jgi:hypothetical protein
MISLGFCRSVTFEEKDLLYLADLKQMNFPLPVPIVPNADSEAVKKLRQRLSVESTAISLRVITEPEEREKSCYVNVQNRIERQGGSMRLGWAVWQHSNLFVEAERHAVYDPGNGRELLDCTPHILPDETECSKILFIPNDGDTYDPDSDYVPDNVRVPLMDDPRISQALNLFSQKTALMNSVPGVDVTLPPDVVRAVAETELKASMLLLSVIQAGGRKGRVGRNDPCPCGSGKKYKRCHGR